MLKVLPKILPLPPSFPKDAGGGRVSSSLSMGSSHSVWFVYFRNSQSQKIRNSMPPLALMQTMISNADMTGTLRSPKSQSGKW